jgi:F0F1-type ATP synthase membrane subunit b/b'
MADISTISHIWNIIVESNTFNFIIFALLIALILKKVNIAGAISALQQKIVKIIDDVKKERDDAHSELLQAEKAVENLSEELKEIVDDAQRSAKVLGERILTEAQKQIEDIEKNATKVIDAEEKLLISNLAKQTSQLSVATAKAHITSVLEQTPTLHEKYIDESIDELDRFNF